MPYIIAVLAMVVIGVGFTLIDRSDQTTDQPPTLAKTEVPADATDTVAQPPTNSVAVSQDSTDEDDEDEWRDEEEDDDDRPSAQPAVAETVAQDLTPTPSPTPTQTAPASDYKDGTYTSHIAFRVPEGNYSMDVTISVANDTVTSVKAAFDSRASRDSYTKRFDGSYASYVTGKDLGTLNLSRIAGASLTTNAFNKALTDIKTQAGA